VHVEQVNRFSGRVIIVLSLIAQLSIVALVPMILLFLFTADRRRPSRSARPLAFPAALLVVAFAALYYLEHYR